MPKNGLFFKPTLLTDVHPSSTVAQQEIFGPVLASMTFRTPAEAVELANNTTYGLAACVWSENINVALDVAAQVKAGVVWVNSTNLFDAACGFGGYRESGYGREGGKEGMFEYLVPAWTARMRKSRGRAASRREQRSENRERRRQRKRRHRPHREAVHRRQAGAARLRLQLPGLQPRGQTRRRSAARQPQGHPQRRRSRRVPPATSGPRPPAHGRAQVLYYIAENLIQRRAEIVRKLAEFVGEAQAEVEFDSSVDRAFTYAAWCDKFEGSVHNPPFRMVTLAMKEAIGTVGILAPDDAPLLGLLSLVLPAIAMGNSVVAVPSERYATLIGELYQVFDTSDLPGGVVNFVAGIPHGARQNARRARRRGRHLELPRRRSRRHGQARLHW